MSALSDRMESLNVRVSVRGGRIVGELRGRAEVRLSFEAESYPRYDERSLEADLVDLARLLWAGRTKRYYEALSEALGQTVTREDPPETPRDVAYDNAREQLVAEGSSTDGLVHLAVRGMREWTVRIADGILRKLDEETFAARVNEAAGELIRDQMAKIRQLKEQIYEPQL